MDYKALSANIAKFSAKFCGELEKGKSVVSSPLSAEYVLALLTLGTTGPAHSELLTALGFPDDDSIRSSFSEVSSKLKALKGVTFNVANKIYVKDGPCELQPTLEADAVQMFDAAIQKLDFRKSATAAAIINQWVDIKTNHKIRDLMASGSFDDDTRLVLINAIYFKGIWKKMFIPANTKNRQFHVNSNLSVNIRTMYIESNIMYGNSTALKAQLLAMPYRGEEASMLVVLPHEIEGLQGVLSQLASGYDLMSDVDKMYKTKVQVSMPKFRIETTIDLNALLPKLGIRAIFDYRNSGLTKVLNNEEPLFVSKALQKAFIEVNEEGAEAAAATVMFGGFGAPSAPQMVQRFVADRPFLVAILVQKVTCFVAMYHGKTF